MKQQWGFYFVKIVLITLLAGKVMALKFDNAVPTDIKDQMLADLKVMSELQGSKQSPMHRQIYKQLAGEQYKNFFESHILSVGMSSCGGGMAVACVQPFSGKKMWLTQNFVKFSHPQIARLMVVYHEARHTEFENGSWAHDTCPEPFLDDSGNEKKSIWTGAPLAGEPACDSTAMGSYGSTTILLKNLAQHCDNCSEKVKMDADLYAMDQLGRISVPQVKKDMLADFEAKVAN